MAKYKIHNPQLVAQHCFFASFGFDVCVFHLARSTCRATNILLRVEVVAKSTGQVCFKQQILALLLIFYQDQDSVYLPFLLILFRNVATYRKVTSRNHQACHTTNLPMLHDKLKVIVCFILPP